MLNKTKMVLAAALILGASSTAFANRMGGYQVQTWQDIAKSRQDVQNQIHRAYHTQNPGNAYGYAPSDNPAPHAR